MQVNRGDTKWLEIKWGPRGDTPMSVFSDSSTRSVTTGRPKWESLLNGSHTQVSMLKKERQNYLPKFCFQVQTALE